MNILLPLLLIFLPPFLPARPAVAAEAHQELNLEGERIRKDNLLTIFFGAPPPLATERGILLIEAFHDRDGDGRRNGNEEELSGEVFCLVDGVEYEVPAFIPGLAYNGNYKVLCAGDRFEPSVRKETILIEQRGQILRLELPCRGLSVRREAVLPPEA